MWLTRLRFLAPALLSMVLANPAHAADSAGSAPSSIPAKVFFRHADISDAALSPSGRYLGVLTGLGGARIGLVVLDLEDGGKPTQAARYSDADVAEFRWVNDNRLVVSLTDLQTGGGDQQFWPGLFSVSRDGSERRQLVKMGTALISAPYGAGREPLSYNHLLLKVPRGSGDEVIVGEWAWNNFNEFDAIRPKRLNVDTGRVVNLAAGAPAHVKDWIFDSKGEPRVAISINAGRTRYFWRAPGQEEYRLLGEYDSLKVPYVPKSVDDSGRLFVLATEGRARTRVLKRFDFNTNAPEPDALVATPGFDMTGFLVGQDSDGQALGVRLHTDAETTVWFDPAMSELQKEADRRLPGRINRLSCRHCGTSKMVALVFSYSDRDPGRYVVYRAEKGQWQDVGRERTDVDPRAMASTDFERIQARDGRDLPVWLTQPAGGKPEKPRPAVVLVHGGPWVRGRYWQWEPHAQFLASRGYVVIEPEFRGSAGFGAAHLEAGFKQWGRAMQDDVSDALAWAVKKGLVDPDRVCIAGASYGGYAALMGVTRGTSEFRCAVAWVAVTDPRLLFEWSLQSETHEEARVYGLPAMIGDPKTDSAALAAVAPVELADKIKVPVLLAFGGGDNRVPFKHGTRMRDALVAAGQKPEWVVYKDEGHGWLRVENRIDFAQRMEAFLAQHLAPR